MSVIQHLWLLLAFLLVGCQTVENVSIDPLERKVPAPEQSIEGHVDIVVHLPLAYNPNGNRRFPVLYFLHGFGSNAGAWARLEGPNSLGDKDFIVVSVDAGASQYSDWEDGQHLGQTLLTDHVVPYVDGAFRTVASREARGILGQSMGGNAALVVAMTRPDLFSCAAAHSAALQPLKFEDLPEFAKTYFEGSETFGKVYGEPFKPEAWNRMNAAHQAVSREAETLKRVGYYFDVGVDDHLGFAERNVALSATLSEKGVPHIFALREGGHNAEFVRLNIPHALDHFETCLASSKTDAE